MDFYTIKQKVLPFTDNPVYPEEVWYEDVLLAIQDECGFNKNQARFVMTEATRKYSDRYNITDRCQELSYNYRNFINLL